jgi:hypothetical protein
MAKSCSSAGTTRWIHTRWTLKRSPDGYRGVFMEMPDASREFPAAGEFAPPLH